MLMSAGGCAALRRRSRTTLLVHELLVVFLSHQLERDENVRRLELFTLLEFDSGIHHRFALTLGILEDRHGQVALLHFLEGISGCIHSADNNTLRVLTGLLQSDNSA